MNAPLTETTNFGLDKIARYKWTVSDKPGVMMEIDKTELVVDASYQRTVSDRDGKVLRMASEWSWVACGAIIVGMRDGVAYVIDGQHRVMAAMKRSDIKKLPCVVFESEAPKDEATAFLRANRNRKPMTTIQAFNALVTSGDEHAVKANELIKQTGRPMARKSSATTFSAPGVVIDCIRQDEQALRRIWPIIVEACKGEAITQSIIQGLFYIETHIEGDSLTNPRWRSRVIKIGATGMAQGIQKARAFYENGGAKIFAAGILECLNKHVRGDKLELRK